MSVTTDASEDLTEMDTDGNVSQAQSQSHTEVKAISEVVFAQSEEQKVTLVAPLPVEVLQVLRNAGAQCSQHTPFSPC